MKFQLKPYLSNLNVPDEVLIEKMNEAASLEVERQNKLKRHVSVKPPRVNKVQAEAQFIHDHPPQDDDDDTQDERQSNGGEKSSKKKPVQHRGPNPETVKLIEGLKADVQEMSLGL